MRVLFYQNNSKSLRIFLDEEGNYDSYTLEIGKEDNSHPFFLPGSYVEGVPMSNNVVPSFIKEIKNFNPLLVKTVGKESDLIKALRETKKCAEKEREFERNNPQVRYSKTHS